MISCMKLKTDSLHSFSSGDDRIVKGLQMLQYLEAEILRCVQPGNRYLYRDEKRQNAMEEFSLHTARKLNEYFDRVAEAIGYDDTCEFWREPTMTLEECERILMPWGKEIDEKDIKSDEPLTTKVLEYCVIPLPLTAEQKKILEDNGVAVVGFSSLKPVGVVYERFGAEYIRYEDGTWTDFEDITLRECLELGTPGAERLEYEFQALISPSQFVSLMESTGWYYIAPKHAFANEKALGFLNFDFAFWQYSVKKVPVEKIEGDYKLYREWKDGTVQQG